MRGDEELARHLPPPGRHAYLDAATVRRLVEAVEPGLKAAANLERYRGGWRLRIMLNKPGGGATRRAVTLPDDETAAWVRDYLVRARVAWRARSPSVEADGAQSCEKSSDSLTWSAPVAPDGMERPL
jgi:hypothetical protein